jgi:4-amino-4-deoxy-L-arabinose transferase-like glycosyltransferase
MQLIQAPSAKTSKLLDEGGSDLRNMLWLGGACLLLFFLALGSWGFIDPGDGYFSEAAREMMERGDYLVPHLNYQIYFSKPILIYWLIISAYKVFGVSEFAARFWSAALATAAVLVTYWTTRTIWTKRAGLIAGIALATSPLVVTFARMSLIDMGFASLLGISLCATAMTLCTSSKRWWPVLYVTLGLAVLDKGPAAAVLYVAGMLGYLVVSKPTAASTWALFGKLKVLPGLLIFTAVAVPWYIAVGFATNWLWPQVFFMFENLGRFAGHTNHRNPSALFYLPVVAYGFFPWSLFLPAALMAPVQDAWRRWQSGATIPRDGRETGEMLFACWSLGVVIFFSLSMTKLQTYVLPAWPAMAALIGISLDRFITLSECGNRMRYLQRAGWIMGTLGALLFITALLASALSFSPALLTSVHATWAQSAQTMLTDIPAILRAGVCLTAFIAATGMIVTWRRLDQQTMARAFAALAVTAVAAGTVGGITFYQLGYKYKNYDLHQVSAVLSNTPGPVALFRDFKPSLVYHLQRPVDSFFAVDQLRPRSTVNNPPAIQYIIAGPKGAHELLATYPSQLHVMSCSGDWYAMSSTELVAVRLPTLERSFTEHIDLGGGEFSWGTLPLAGGTKP